MQEKVNASKQFAWNMGDIWDSPVCPPSSTGSDPTVPYPPHPLPPTQSYTTGYLEIPLRSCCIKGLSVKECFGGNRTTENLYYPCLKIFQRDRFQIWIFQKLPSHTRNWFGINVGVRRGLLMKKQWCQNLWYSPFNSFFFLSIYCILDENYIILVNLFSTYCNL